jgi:hypothetical protein
VAATSTSAPVVDPTGTVGSGPLTVSTPVAPENGPTTARIPDLADGATPSPARSGQTGATQRRTFAPTSITLHPRSGTSASATVERIDTSASGELTLPADPGRVGWWQSGALAGDLYGSVVLAGHIDSRDRGLGFFARLLLVRAGDEVVLSDGVDDQRYRVVETRDVPKASVATSTDTFSQRVAGRLVLLTCTGRWSAVTHYPDNLVVTAEPLGVATPHR